MKIHNSISPLPRQVEGLANQAVTYYSRSSEKNSSDKAFTDRPGAAENVVRPIGELPNAPRKSKQ